MGSHDCWGESVVNDVTSNGKMVVEVELKLRDALLKFRGPEIGDSEVWIGVEISVEVPVGSMMSVSKRERERRTLSRRA